MDCSLLITWLRDMHVGCCLIIEFGRSVIQEFGEVESGNSGIQLRKYTFTRVTKQLVVAQPSLGIVFKEEASNRDFLMFSF